MRRLLIIGVLAFTSALVMTKSANSVQPPPTGNTQQRYFLVTCSMLPNDTGKVILKIDSYTGQTWSLALNEERPGLLWKKVKDFVE